MFLPPSLFSPALRCFVFRHLAFFLQKCDFQSGFAVGLVFAPPFFSRNTRLFWALLNPSFFDALFLDIMWPAKKIIILLVSFLVLWCFVFQHLGLLGPPDRLHVGSWCGVGGGQLGGTHFFEVCLAAPRWPLRFGQSPTKTSTF